MANKLNTPDAYNVEPRFIFQATRNMGFTPKSCVFELIDNSIDAGAKRIDITWKKNHFGLYDLIVEDNGDGMHNDKIKPNLATLGTPEQYTADRVGYYGVGFNAAIINLMEEGTSSITTTHKKKTSTFKITHQDHNVYFDGPHDKGNIGKSNGTKIHIPNVDKPIKPTTLIRDIAVTYYPKTVFDKKFEIYVNGKKIQFIDPLYSDEVKANTKGFDSRFERKFKYNKKWFKLKAVAFDPEIDMDPKTSKLSMWDRKDGKPKFKPHNSGFYLKLGSTRYINVGDGIFPGFTVHRLAMMSRFRFELELPKKFIEDFGIQVNKSAKIQFMDDDPEMQEFYKSVKEMCNEFADWWKNFQGKPQTEEMKKNIDKLNKRLNQIITDAGRMRPLVNTAGVLESGIVETREFNGRDPEGDGIEPTDSGKTRRGKDKQKRQPRMPKLPINLDIESQGKTMPMVDWFESDGVLNVILNSDCEWVGMFCKDPIDTQIIPVLKIYSFIDTISRLGRDKNDCEDWKRDIKEIVSEETDMLNKVLAN